MSGRKLHKLTARSVESAKHGRHGDGGGLYLIVGPSRKSWSFLFILNGKRQEMGLGSSATVSLADARRKAESARRMLADGINPLEAKKAAEREQRAPTFGLFVDDYLVTMRASWRNDKHAAQWAMTLGRARDKEGNLTKRGYCLSLANLRLDEITTEDVLKELRPIWTEKRETASRVRGRIEMILDAAKAAGYRDGPNPALWRGHLALLLPKRARLKRGHHAAMPYSDVPAFVKRLREAKGLGAMALEFTILTAARSGEVRGALWAEVDLKKMIWTVPGDRMKAGRAHRVPLTDRAISILEQAALLRRPAAGGDDEALVFPSTKIGRPLSDMTLSAVLRRMDLGEFTVHGFRSSFRDWAGDETHFPREVAEAALAHVVTGVEGAYRRGDALEKRRELMTMWADYIDTKPGKSTSKGNVLAFDRSAVAR